MKIYGKLELDSAVGNVTEAIGGLIDKAKLWEYMGAAGVYVRCAPGCKYEAEQYLNAVKELIKAVGIPVTTELRAVDIADYKRILRLGSESLVIETEAVENEPLMDILFKTCGSKVSVLLDSDNDAISPRSWVNIGGFSAYNFVGKLAEKGCRSVIYADKGEKSSTCSIYDTVERLCSIGRVKVTLSGRPNSAEELLKLKNSGIEGFIMDAPDILRSYNY